MPYDPATRSRLAAILGMLGSDSDNEALTAARQATRIQKQSGLTWDKLLAVPANGPPLAPVVPVVRHPNPERRERCPDIICPMSAWCMVVAYVSGLHYAGTDGIARWLRTLYDDPAVKSVTWQPTYGAAVVLARLWREGRGR